MSQFLSRGGGQHRKAERTPSEALRSFNDQLGKGQALQVFRYQRNRNLRVGTENLPVTLQARL